MSIKEDLLHYAWRTKRFHLRNLTTTEGESVEIIDFGKHNTHAGPDFFNAKVKIGTTLWAGNVEMHVLASDWMKHRHNEDRAYDNVILHVVLEEDNPVYSADQSRIPCLELRGRIPLKISNTYQKLQANESWIPCEHHFHTANELTKRMWLDRMLVERLEQKTNLVQLELSKNQNDWEETFYWFLAKHFGLKINVEPFENLAKSLPLKILNRYKDQLFQLESLLFGQAALLDKDFEEDYPNRLKKEYDFLRHKHRLQPISAVAWKFMRLRPANFPTIRIAQFAALLHQRDHLFSSVLAAKQLADIEALFQVALDGYWNTHYVFDKISKKRKKSLGKATVRLLIINTIVPFLFLYGTTRDLKHQREKALLFLDQLPPESNSIISAWKGLGIVPQSAYDTQALLQLKNAHCNASRCLDCSIGDQILQ
ncbi:MAG: DUF2851 family protein [Bacteroidota bacterium]